MSIIREFKSAFLKAFVETIIKNYGDQPNQSQIKKIMLEDKSWSIWVLETKEGVQLLSVQGYIDDAVPEDGSFICAFQLSNNLTEEQADQMMEQISKDREAQI